MRIFGISAILLAVLIWNVPGFVRAADGDLIASGTQGSVIWQVSENESGDYVLYLSGSGELPDMTSGFHNWMNLDPADLSKIRVVQIYSGVTGLGTYTLYDLKNLTSVSSAKTLSNIAEYSFDTTGLAPSFYFYGTDAEYSAVRVDPTIDSWLGTPVTYPDADMPTIAPVIPTATPTLEPTGTPTATPTATATAAATATPTRTPAPATATPAATATAAAATATPTIRATATPTTRPTAAATATPIPWPNAYGGAGGNQTYVYSGNAAYNPGAVVRTNAYDMPRTGDGDAARLIIVAVLFIVGCIALVSTIPSKNQT